MAHDPVFESARIDFCVDTLLMLAVAAKRNGQLSKGDVLGIDHNFSVLERAAHYAGIETRECVERQRKYFNAA